VCRAGSAEEGGAAEQRLHAMRLRSSCRVREDFTGRGFGSVRLREAR
jgi:hypothetical protein